MARGILSALLVVTFAVFVCAERPIDLTPYQAEAVDPNDVPLVLDEHMPAVADNFDMDNELDELLPQVFSSDQHLDQDPSAEAEVDAPHATPDVVSPSAEPESQKMEPEATPDQNDAPFEVDALGNSDDVVAPTLDETKPTATPAQKSSTVKNAAASGGVTAASPVPAAGQPGAADSKSNASDGVSIPVTIDSDKKQADKDAATKDAAPAAPAKDAAPAADKGTSIPVTVESDSKPADSKPADSKPAADAKKDDSTEVPVTVEKDTSKAAKADAAKATPDTTTEIPVTVDSDNEAAANVLPPVAPKADNLNGMWRDYQQQVLNADKAKSVAVAKSESKDVDASKFEMMAEGAARDAEEKKLNLRAATEKVLPREGGDLSEATAATLGKLTKSKVAELWRESEEKQANARKAKFVATSSVGTDTQRSDEQGAIKSEKEADAADKKYESAKASLDSLDKQVKKSDMSMQESAAASTGVNTLLVVSVAALVAHWVM